MRARPGAFLFAGLLLAGAALLRLDAAYPRTISFSGTSWSVKTSSGRVGPGPNYFSDSTSNVWVDGQGRLHLKILKVKNRWTCAEVVSQASFGHGTYRFFLDSPVDALDPSAVLGLFTWSDDPAYSNREIDVEMSRWGSAANQNAQYVVQPYTLASNIHRFQWPAVTPSSHSFAWTSGRVEFQSVDTTTSSVLQSWTCTNAVPVPGGENARMNLWLYKGRAPKSGQAVEVVVNRFEFTPAP